MEPAHPRNEIEFDVLGVTVEKERLGGQDLTVFADLHGDGLTGESRRADIHHHARRSVLGDGTADFETGDADILQLIGGSA